MSCLIFSTKKKKKKNQNVVCCSYSTNHCHKRRSITTGSEVNCYARLGCTLHLKRDRCLFLVVHLFHCFLLKDIFYFWKKMVIKNVNSCLGFMKSTLGLFMVLTWLKNPSSYQNMSCGHLGWWGVNKGLLYLKRWGKGLVISIRLFLDCH